MAAWQSRIDKLAADIQQDGQVVKILDNGDGTYSVVVRDMSNPSGLPTTVIGNMTARQVQSRIDRGFWE